MSIPYPLIFQYPSSDTADKQAAGLKQTWEKAGFKVTLDGLGDTYYDVIQKPDNDGDVMWAGWGADWPSAITVTPPLFDSRPNSGQSTSNGQDYGDYQSDAFNALVDQAQSASSLDDQTKALQEADLRLGKDAAYIPLDFQKFYFLYGSKVHGYVNTPSSAATRTSVRSGSRTDPPVVPNHAHVGRSPQAAARLPCHALIPAGLLWTNR